jgi:hypothetical protein
MGGYLGIYIPKLHGFGYRLGAGGILFDKLLSLSSLIVAKVQTCLAGEVLSKDVRIE